MKDKEYKRHMAYEALVLLGLLALLTYIMRRFWHVKLVMAKLLNECLPTTML